MQRGVLRLQSMDAPQARGPRHLDRLSAHRPLLFVFVFCGQWSATRKNVRVHLKSQLEENVSVAFPTGRLMTYSIASRRNASTFAFQSTLQRSTKDLTISVASALDLLVAESVGSGRSVSVTASTISFKIASTNAS